MQNIDDLKGILEEYVQNSNQVFITGHIEPDFDSIASSIAMALLIKKYKKPVYIIFDEDKDKIQIGVNTILDEAKYRISFIGKLSYSLCNFFLSFTNVSYIQILLFCYALLPIHNMNVQSDH